MTRGRSVARGVALAWLPGAMLAIAALRPTAVAAQTAPFGLVFGTTLDSLRKVVRDLRPTRVPGVFEGTVVPVPHSTFQTYLVVVSPTRGLCKVVATSYTVEPDAYGERVRSMFADVREALTAKYGEPQMFDLLKTGSLWKEPREWVMGILQKDRKYVAFWGANGNPIQPGLDGIALSVVATGMSSTQLQLGYEAEDFGGCLAETRAAESKAF